MQSEGTKCKQKETEGEIIVRNYQKNVAGIIPVWEFAVLSQRKSRSFVSNKPFFRFEKAVLSNRISRSFSAGFLTDSPEYTDLAARGKGNQTSEIP